METQRNTGGRARPVRFASTSRWSDRGAIDGGDGRGRHRDDNPSDRAAFVRAVLDLEAAAPDAFREELQRPPALEPSELADAVHGQRVQSQTPVAPAVVDRLS